MEAIDLFMITDEKVIKTLMKDVKEGLPPEIAKKMVGSGEGGAYKQYFQQSTCRKGSFVME